MHTSDDNNMPGDISATDSPGFDAVETEAADTDAPEPRILNPFLFNMQGGDGTHGLTRKSQPHLTLVMPEEPDDEEMPACLHIAPTEQFVERTTEGAEQTEIAAVAEQPISAVEWAGGDVAAWRSTAEPTESAVDAAPAAIAEQPAARDVVETPIPVITLPKPVPVTPTVHVPAFVRKPTQTPRPVAVNRVHTVRAAASLAAALAARAAKSVRKNSGRFAGVLADMPARMRAKVPHPADAMTHLRAWTWRQARSLKSRLATGYLADFRWPVMLKVAGTTATGGIGFILVMQKVLN